MYNVINNNIVDCNHHHTIDNTYDEELQKQIYVLQQKLSPIQRDHTITKPGMCAWLHAFLVYM